MKKYIIFALCIINSLNGMEKQIIRHGNHEWDAQAYSEGNKVQSFVFMNFLKTNKIETANRTILDIGCGTGNIAAELAKKASFIHGFDASKNMITFAQNKHGHINNLSFECSFAEDFQSLQRYQLALASFCVHWFTNQKQAFQQINDCLENNGEFFATASTRKEKQSNTLVNLLTEIPDLNDIVFNNSGKNISDLTGCSYPSIEELKTMLDETGFEIIKCREEYLSHTITKNELQQLHWPIIASRPIIQYIPTDLVQPVFEKYIDILVSKMPKANDTELFCNFSTTIIHARKVKNNS